MGPLRDDIEQANKGRTPDPTEQLYSLATELRAESREGALTADTLEGMAEGIEQEFGGPLRTVLALANGMDLEMLMHPWGEHRWFFKHVYREVPEGQRFGTPNVICDWTCMVDYRQGVLQPWLDISMHVIIPSRLGKEYAYGLDISPGAKTFLCFKYQYNAERDCFRLMKVEKGAREVCDLSEMWDAPKDSSIVKPIELPFPIVVEDTISREHVDTSGDKPRWYGDFVVPFPGTEGGRGVVLQTRFPSSLVR